MASSHPLLHHQGLHRSCRGQVGSWTKDQEGQDSYQGLLQLCRVSGIHSAIREGPWTLRPSGRVPQQSPKLLQVDVKYLERKCCLLFWQGWGKGVLLQSGECPW